MIVKINFMPENIFFEFDLDLKNVNISEGIKLGVKMLHQANMIPRILHDNDRISIDGINYLIMEINVAEKEA